MSDEIQQAFYYYSDYLLFPVRAVIWILVLPIKLLTKVVGSIKVNLYNPEKVVCPACGFKGDSGTGNRTCRIVFKRIVESQKGAIEHTCFRCTAQFYTNTYLSVDQWVSPVRQDQVAKIREAVAKEIL